MLKNLLKKMKKEKKGAPIIEMIIAFPLIVIVIAFFVQMGMYTYTQSDMGTTVDEVAKVVALELRGGQGSLDVVGTQDEAYMNSLVASVLPKPGRFPFRDEERKPLSSAEIEGLILYDDEELCKTKIDNKENVICIYTNTVVEGVTKEVVHVRMYSAYSFFAAFDGLNQEINPSSSKVLDLGTPNPNF